MPPGPMTKKRKGLPELSLPDAEGSDVEDDEIEWLEWVLKKEKGKTKAEEEVLVDDGLDGA